VKRIQADVVDLGFGYGGVAIGTNAITRRFESRAFSAECLESKWTGHG
jgi:hypothetical protein